MSAASIITRLDQTLSPLGFKRKKATWNRESGQFVDVLDVQVSTTMSKATLNIGVMERGVYATCWGRDSEPFAAEPFCTVRARIGEFLDGKDKWWGLKVGDDSANEMIVCIGAHAVPFYERMHSLLEMCNWLTARGAPSPRDPLPAISLAVLRHRIGDQINACSVLADLQTRALGAWKARAEEVSYRIGCA